MDEIERKYKPIIEPYLDCVSLPTASLATATKPDDRILMCIQLALGYVPDLWLDITACYCHHYCMEDEMYFQGWHMLISLLLRKFNIPVMYNC